MKYLKLLKNKFEIITRIYYRILSIIRVKFWNKKDMPYGIINNNRYDLFENEEKFKIDFLPKGYKAAFILSFDDFCVKSPQEGDFDFGGIAYKGINKKIFDLVRKYPFLKITLFTVPNHLNKGIGSLYKPYDKKKFEITNQKYKKWVKMIKSKEFQNNFEIANHGLYHCQNDIHNFFIAREFAFKNYNQMKDTMKKSKQYFDEIGIKTYGMRPPAYGIDKNLNLIKVLKEMGFKYIAFSTPKNGLNDRKKIVSNIYPTKIEGMWNIPENISLAEDIDEIIKKIDEIVKRNGIIHIKGHYIEGIDWLNNGIDNENIKKLEKIIDYLEKKYKNKIFYSKLIKLLNGGENGF